MPAIGVGQARGGAAGLAAADAAIVDDEHRLLVPREVTGDAQARDAGTNDPKNGSYPGAASIGGGVGKADWPTMRWQM
jgi:hypothetical protein